MRLFQHLLESIEDEYPGSVDINSADSEWDSGHKNDFPPAFQKEIERRRRRHPNRKHLGSGLFSYVDQDQSPHEMDNVSRVHSDPNDGSLAWYSIIADNPQLSSNPYLPKVRAKVKAGDYPEFVVEKLYPMSTFKYNSPILRSILSRALGDYPGPEFIPTVTGGAFIQAIREYIVMGLQDPDADPQFQQMVDLLQNIVKNSNYRFDIHYGNIMFRITGNVPQLVIVDPLSYYKVKK